MLVDSNPPDAAISESMEAGSLPAVMLMSRTGRPGSIMRSGGAGRY